MKSVFAIYWNIFFKALKFGQENAAIADQIAGSFMKYLKELIKSQ